jgi:hypothetical protein
MKHQWLAYVVVGVLSIGAGVAIAGLPNNTPVDATIVVPVTSVASPPTSDDTTTTETTETTEPDPTTTATTTTIPASTTTSTVTTTTSSLPGDDLPTRSELSTVVANGANIAGAAVRNVERLRPLGYTDIVPRNGTAVFDFTTIFYADGFADAAARLADDLDLLADFVAPLADAPEVLDLPDGVELLAYIGIDRAG